MSPGGKRTSHGGQILEAVPRSLKLMGFTRFTAKQYDRHIDGMYATSEDRSLVCHYPYYTLFGTKGWREYCVFSKEWDGHIECKFQAGSGSCDEKVALLYLNMIAPDSCVPNLCVIFGGPWWDTGRGLAIKNWLASKTLEVSERYDKDLFVFDVDGFLTWAQRTWTNKRA